jgi:hypothetical protein
MNELALLPHDKAYHNRIEIDKSLLWRGSHDGQKIGSIGVNALSAKDSNGKGNSK